MKNIALAAFISLALLPNAFCRPVTLETQPEWALFWEKNGAGKALPEVDFSRDRVEAILTAEKLQWRAVPRGRSASEDRRPALAAEAAQSLDRARETIAQLNDRSLDPRVWDGPGVAPTLEDPVPVSAASRKPPFNVQVGVMGWDSDANVLGASPYFLIETGERTWSKGPYFRRRSMGAALIAARARLFADDTSRRDKSFDDLRESVITLSEQYGGLNEQTQGVLKNDFKVDYAFKDTPIPVLSAFDQVGRSYPTPLPIDITWMVTGLYKQNYIFPNLQTDASVGARFRFSSLPFQWALMLGDSQNLSPISDFPTQQALTRRSSKLRMAQANLDQAPHVGAAAWGDLPWGTGQWRTEGSAQWNPLATDVRLAGDVAPLLRGRPVTIGVEARREYGSGIEYDRRRLGLTAGYSPRPWLTVQAGVRQEQFRYGNAYFEGTGAYVGLQGTWEKRSGRRVNATVAVEAPAVDRQNYGTEHYEAEWAKVIEDLKEIEARLLAEDDPALQEFADKVREFESVINFGISQLSDGAFIERVLVRYARSLTQREFSKSRIKFDLGPKRVILGGFGPANIIGAAAIANSRLSPLPPVRKGDMEEYVLPWMYWQATRQFGEENKNASEEDLITILIDQAPEETRGIIREKYGDDISELTGDVGALGHILRAQANLAAQQSLRGAGAMDVVSVDRGRKAGRIGSDGMVDIWQDPNTK